MQTRVLRADWRLPDHLPSGVRTFLEVFLTNVVETLKDSIEGIVLFGSLVAGDFDPGTSDLDLLVAVSADLDDAAVESLRRMHDQLVWAHPEWEDRVDVTYVSAVALETFKERDSPLVVISPGEPINRTRTDPGWVMNWHVAREVGVALLGPSPRDLIATTTEADFVTAVRFYMRWMLAKAESSDAPELLAYAILTSCRALYTCSTWGQASKKAAALWAERRYPEWSAPIRSGRRQFAMPVNGARRRQVGNPWRRHPSSAVSISSASRRERCPGTRSSPPGKGLQLRGPLHPV
jgi:predicted nucleotidyltransferase